MDDLNGKVLEKNVELCVRKGALPVSQAQESESFRRFQRRIAPTRIPSRRPRLAVAAALLAFLGVLGTLLLDSRGRKLDSSGVPGGQEKSRAEKLIDLLTADDPQARESGARGLLDLGEGARSALDRAAKSDDRKLRLRALDLLFRLDIDKYTGRLKDGRLFWIRKPVYSIFGNPALMPEWMKEPLAGDEKLLFILVSHDAKRVTGSVVCPWDSTMPTLFTAVRHTEFVLGGPDPIYTRSAHPHQGDPDPDSQKTTALELLKRSGPWLNTSLVMVFRNHPATLWGAVREATREKDAVVRAGSLHALRHLVRLESIDLAVAAQDDSHPFVRDAARGTLKSICSLKDDAVPAFAIEWKTLDRKKKTEFMLERWKTDWSRSGIKKADRR